ncbi:VQ motif-containing protein 25 [Prunus yedoensis var. nudiflora]|uniref:VQ motif-containing protein 25 n=1 Tax=Prunus yedoensis var. nudiflora TaxID=2094558 RepID=A0A314ZNQ1_PRUYE|nr:VQ motif-containing protein 25 [Prunus yedoensis var. nudiflora]
MMKKPQYSSCNPSSASSKLGMHKESHKISKTASKPKIRIIHVLAPEIIKTDVANFRELVQNLTGKPAAAPEVVNGSRKKTIRCPTYSSPSKKILELQNDGDQRVKEEIQNYTWRSSSFIISAFRLQPRQNLPVGLPGLVGPMAFSGSYSRSGGLLGLQGGPFARFTPSGGHALKGRLIMSYQSFGSSHFLKYGLSLAIENLLFVDLAMVIEEFQEKDDGRKSLRLEGYGVYSLERYEEEGKS